MKRYYILAKDNKHYMAWMKSGRPHQIIPELAANLPCRITYIDRDYIIRGLSEINGFILPGADERPDYQQILDMINIIKSKQYTIQNTGAISGTMGYNTTTNSITITSANSAKQPTIIGNNITGGVLDELDE